MTVTFSLYISHTLTEVDPDTGERHSFGSAYVFGPIEICTTQIPSARHRTTQHILGIQA